MTKKGKILLGTTLAGLIGAVALAGAVHADSERHGRGYGPGFDGGHHMGMPGHMGGGHMGGGHMGPRGEMMRQMFDLADADKDGKVTQAEIDKARDERFAKYDANKDGKLNLEEFEGLLREITRPMTVRAFQHLDPDGDAAITAEELARPTAGIVSRMDRNGDGALSEDGRGRHHWWDRDDDDKKSDDDRRGPGMMRRN